MQTQKKDVFALMDKMLNSETLLECAGFMKEFSEAVMLEKSKLEIVNEFTSSLAQRLETGYMGSQGEGVRLLEGNDAVIVYLTNWIVDERSPTHLLKSLQELSIEMQSKYSISDEPGVSKEFVQEVLGFLERRYDFTQNILNDIPLTVCFFTEKNKLVNGICVPKPMPSGINQIFLELYPVRDRMAGDPHYVFFHELGHAVQIQFADMFDVPECFLELDLHREEMQSRTQHEVNEAFADAFAMTIMLEERYSQYDPFTMISRKHKESFRQYFDQLILGI